MGHRYPRGASDPGTDNSRPLWPKRPRAIHTSTLATAGAILSLFLHPGTAHAERWAGAWGFAASALPMAADRQLPPGTMRYRIRLTNGGDAIALTLSNAEGTSGLRIGSVTVARAATAEGLSFREDSLRQLTFNGTKGIDLVPGRSMVSDAVAFQIAPEEDLIVSVRLIDPTAPLETGLQMPSVGFVADRDATGEAAPSDVRRLAVRPFVSLISVRNPIRRCTVVTFGDSITDGATSVDAMMRGWPGRLAQRLSALPTDRACGVVNLGIGGNRLLANGQAMAAAERFARDVAMVPGATHLILLEGINDIGTGPPALADLALALEQIAARARQLGIKVVGGTLTPALGAGYMSPEKDEIRQALNRFIRTSGAFDAVIDFDRIVEDPAHPGHLRPAFDPGDHLHPNDAGYRAIGDAIDLSLFAPEGGRPHMEEGAAERSFQLSGAEHSITR